MKQLILCLVSGLLIAATPAPTGHINDLANIIPDDREAVLEQTLRTYETQTEIEIAVVTTPTLDGKEIEDYSIDLARSWGVGKQGANNGVLVVIAPNDRKYRIEVGYGLEGDLTDADSSTLAEAALVSAFRAGDYPGGIERLTQALTTHLGTMTPEQRIEFRRKMADAERKNAQARKAALYSFMGWAFGALLVLGGIALCIYIVRTLLKKYRTWVRNKQRRKALYEYLQSTDAIPDQLMQAVEELDLPNLPAWMQDDKEGLEFSLEDTLETAGQMRKQMEGLIEVDLDQAEALRVKIRQWLEDAAAYLDRLRAIPNEVQKFRLACEGAVQQVVKEIDDLLAYVSVLSQKQYRVAALVPSLDVNRLRDEKQNITILLRDRGEGLLDASELVHDKAIRLQTKVRTLKERLDGAMEMQSSSERRIAALTKRAGTLTSLLDEHRLRLERLRAIAPEARFVSFVEGLPIFERALTGIAPRLEAAVRDNSMELQLFAEAAKNLDGAEANLQSVDDTVNQAKQLEQSVTEAKQQFASKQKNTQQAITAAKRLMSDGDVGNGAKNRLKEAERILESIAIDAAMPDWIAVAALHAQASAKAKQAEELAQIDIDSAKRERRRQEEEEERRRKRAREASMSSSNSSFGSSSSSSGSFGGFGGGDFGGGGSSGSW